MCVFKYHAFIYFLRPPPWYGTLIFMKFLLNKSLILICFLTQRKYYVEMVVLKQCSINHYYSFYSLATILTEESEMVRWLPGIGKKSSWFYTAVSGSLLLQPDGWFLPTNDNWIGCVCLGSYRETAPVIRHLYSQIKPSKRQRVRA